MPLWSSVPVKVLRWIAFLPLAFLLLALWQALGAFCWRLLADVKVDSLLEVVIAIIIAGVAINLVFLWIAAFAGIPYYLCTVVAPNSRVAAVMFGTLFGFLHGSRVVFLFVEGALWWGVGSLVVLLLVFGGLIASYNEDTSD